jgi:predicted SnoaL-like aldol condensation-catalyzing enzyme
MDTLEMNPKSNDVNHSQNESAKSAKEIVMEYLQALIERRDFKSARSYLKDNVTYVSPLNSFDGVEPYLKYNESLHLPKPDIKKVITDGDDVCLLYEMTLTTQPAPLFVSFWAHIDGGKISSIKLVFDPRPFIRPGR